MKAIKTVWRISTFTLGILIGAWLGWANDGWSWGIVTGATIGGGFGSLIAAFPEQFFDALFDVVVRLLFGMLDGC